MKQTKIERLKALKEEFARTQTALQAARKLEESAQSYSMATLLENDLEQAELVLAAQDIMHKLQNMAEDLAKMNAQDLFPLVDKMKATFGQEAAHAFEETSQEVISNAMNTVRHAKDELGNSIMRLEGKVPQNDMSADAALDPGADMSAAPAAAPAADAVDSAMDSFGGADAAAGPVEEPLGRARKESVEGGKALNESMILESAGRKLLETESLASLISWVLNEAAAGMPEAHFRSFATSIATKAATDPIKTAGWIGKKKLGMAAMAQLAQPNFTQEPKKQAEKQPEPQLEVMEGKTFKNSDDEDDNWNKKNSDKARQAARKNKQDDLEEGKSFKNNDDDDDNWNKKSKDSARQNARKNKQDDLEEGKSFKNNDDDDDNWNKKHSDKARQTARKSKDKDELDETRLAARAVAQIIEANIAREGKGKAAHAVKEAIAYLAGKNLVEGEFDYELAIMEAFESEYGVRPATYSVSKLKEFQAPKPPMNPTDKKNASMAMTKLAGTMGANKSVANQSVQSAMTGMTGQERNAATKMLNKMKQDGQAPKNAGEFAQQASSLVNGDDETNESKGENKQFARRQVRKAVNRAQDPSSKMAHGYGGVTKFASTKGEEEELDENINAAHWPTDTHGQYKGEPLQTDYQKLKVNPTAPAKTEKTTDTGTTEAPKAEKPEGETAKPSGNPFAKKDEPAEEADTTDEDSEK